jgi:hypothetical protein
VPFSRDRAVSNDTALSPQLVALWETLFTQLRSHHPAFPRTLINAIVARLSLSNVHTIDQARELSEERHDTSYKKCIANWAIWAVENWIGVDPDIRRHTVISLAVALGPELAVDGTRCVWITSTADLIAILLH